VDIASTTPLHLTKSASEGH